MGDHVGILGVVLLLLAPISSLIIDIVYILSISYVLILKYVHQCFFISLSVVEFLFLYLLFPPSHQKYMVQMVLLEYGQIGWIDTSASEIMLMVTVIHL